MKNILSEVELITLNVASFGWILIDVIQKTPSWVTAGIGLSIMFFNIARGIAVLRKKNKDEIK